MDLKYRYDPRWQLIVMSWGFAAVLAIAALTGWTPKTLMFGLSLFFAVMATVLMIRRYCFSKTLELDEEGMWLPSGFLQLRTRRIVFSEVTEAWEAFAPRMVVLCLRYHGKKLEMSSILLKDHDTYLEVAGYIYSRVKHD